MAKILDYTTDQGIDLPESYWCVRQIDIRVDELKARVFFSCYKDKESRLAGKSPIASRNYLIFGEQFSDYYTKVIEDRKNPAEAAYEFVSSLEDVAHDDGKRSFFTGAKDDL